MASRRNPTLVAENHHPRSSRPSDESRLKRPSKRARPSSDATSTATAISSSSRPAKAHRSSASDTPAPRARRKSAAAVKAEQKAEPKLEVRVKPEPKSEPVPMDDGGGPSTPNGARAASNGNNGNNNNGDSPSNDDGYRWWKSDGAEDDKNRWTTLEHNAVMFPPDYEPHNIPLKYAGQPVPLEPKGEEIATFYAAKLGTDYVTKPIFNRNFFEDFRDALKGTPAHAVVRDLEQCDFGDIAAHLEHKKAESKNVTSAEKKRAREEEARRCEKFTHAKIDGRLEKIGNFRVEPPGLFLGRGEHPKAGRVKARIFPENITLNLGESAPVPECPMEGHRWGNIVHKHDVTWLCGWKDSITGGSKYVWLSAGSSFKGKSDHAKFEKARKLSDHIDAIRRDYREGWKSRGKEVRQRSVAMYLIDKLALRVGNEKGEEEADTVGCCSLRVEHIKFEPPRTIQFDFLGKDSIRYLNSVEVEKPVYESMKLFVRNKQPTDEIFHRLSVTSLNEYLKSLMDGLSAKVFRTYNASHTLDELLQPTPRDADVNQKVVFYNKQNKEVAILCNHQRSLPKAHESQMEKLDKRVSEAHEWLEELKGGRKKLTQGKKAKKAAASSETVELRQWVHEKPKLTDDMDEKQRAEERKRAAEAPRILMMRTKKLSQIDANIKTMTERISKLEADMQVKDDLKTVALGTSKINYLDPRITVAWCKKHDVPIEKVFAKTLLVKFAWAMEASEDFRF